MNALISAFWRLEILSEGSLWCRNVSFFFPSLFLDSELYVVWEMSLIAQSPGDLWLFFYYAWLPSPSLWLMFTSLWLNQEDFLMEPKYFSQDLHWSKGHCFFLLTFFFLVFVFSFIVLSLSLCLVLSHTSQFWTRGLFKFLRNHSTFPFFSNVKKIKKINDTCMIPVSFNIQK